MRSVRFIANFLFYISRAVAVFFLVITFYALVIIILSGISKASWVPIEIEKGYFRIFYPFTKTTFLLGDYSASFLVTYLFTLGFYGLFLWLLSDVFFAFRQKKLFTKRGVSQLSRFYTVNLVMPILFGLFLVLWKEDFSELIRIIFLHLVIGVFAFFMAAIFKQGLLLQEEQDLTF